MQPRQCLGDIASAIKSQNSGATHYAFAVMFDDAATYQVVRDSGTLSSVAVAEAYGIDSSAVEIHEFEPALSSVVSFPRPTLNGNPGDTDVDGAQQHIPLMLLPVAEEVGTAGDSPSAARRVKELLVSSAADSLWEAFRADGFEVDISGSQDSVAVDIREGAAECGDCTVPPAILESIVHGFTTEHGISPDDYSLEVSTPLSRRETKGK